MTLGELSVLVSMAGVLPYAKGIIVGKTRPHRISWFIWTFILALTLWGYRSAGAQDSAWFIAGDLLVTGLIFLLSLWRGKGGYERTDIICLVIALLGLLFWQISNLPVVALLGTLLADCMGLVLTVRGALRDPVSEHASTYGFSSVAALLGILSVGQWNMLLLFYPFYLFLANFVTVIVVLVGQYQVAHFDATRTTRAGA